MLLGQESKNIKFLRKNLLMRFRVGNIYIIGSADMQSGFLFIHLAAKYSQYCVKNQPTYRYILGECDNVNCMFKSSFSLILEL